MIKLLQIIAITLILALYNIDLCFAQINETSNNNQSQNSGQNIEHQDVKSENNESPDIANKIENVTPTSLENKIKLSIRSQSQNYPLKNNDVLNLEFCEEKTRVLDTYFNGRKIKRNEIVCLSNERKLNLQGKTQNSGINIIPEIKGEWRWDGDYDLSFTPKNNWADGINYQIAIDKNIFPHFVDLQQTSFSFATEPLKASINEMKFFQDFNEDNKRGVSAIIKFNYAIDEKQLRENINLLIENVNIDKTQKPVLVPADKKLIPEIKMNEYNTEAAINIVLGKLSDEDSFLNLSVNPDLKAKHGGNKLGLRDEYGQVFSQRVLIPGRLNYGKIEHIDLQIVKNNNYEPEQILIVQTNIPVSSPEIVKNLQIYQLPKDKVNEAKSASPQRDYRWESTTEIKEEFLQKLPKLQFKIQPSNDDFSTMHSLKLDTAPNSWIYVRVNKGVNAKNNYILGNQYNKTVKVPDYAKEVKILSEGALLSLSGDRKISVYSLGAKKIKFEVSRVITNNINHFVSQSYGNFKNPEFQNWNLSEKNLSEVFGEERIINNASDRKPYFDAFDFTPYINKNDGDKNLIFKDAPKGKGLFFLSIKGLSKDKDGKEIIVSEDKRFILVSDLGFVVKTNRDGTRDIFVQSLKSGESVGSTKIEVLGLNGIPVFSGETDGNGHIIVPNLEGFENEKKPVAYIVKKGDDLSFMRYESSDRNLDYSKFDVDGLNVSDEGLRALLFSDRGIYRPGEEIKIGIIVKQGDWAQNLEGLPLKLEVTNSRGQVVDNQMVKIDKTGLAEYKFATKEISPTGVYNIRLYINKNSKNASQLGNVAVKIEEFLPDTMRITSEFNKKISKGWLKPEGIKANIDLQHLYGLPATNHRIKADITLAPANFAFKDYADYNFFDALKANKNFSQTIGEKQTNDNGKASFDLNLEQFGNSTYQLTFLGEAFAQDSGRSVKTSKTVLVSPLNYVIGTKANNLEYIDKNDERILSLIAIDPDLKRIAVKDLSLKLFQINHVSSLIKNERGLYEYKSVAKEKLIGNKKINIAIEGLDYNIDTTKSGQYALVIENDQNLILNRIDYTVVGTENLSGGVQKDAPISIKLDRQEYGKNDVIKMNVVSPYTGSGLITIETDKVLAHKWFSTKTTSSIQEIEIPEDLTGKAFVNVQFVRSLTSKEIYTKPLAYNVQPFFVSTESVDSKIILEVDKQVRPGEELAIGYSTNKSSKIIIYAVDEGILQYGKYKTPNPLEYFVGKRALQVETSQILDLLMPEYSLMHNFAASGGDMSLNDGKNLNPFKRKTLPPVAFWSGIIDSDENKKSIIYKVPEYFNGNLRVMAIAVSDKDMGVTETKSIVKGDIIVSPNVPLFAAPSDEFVVGINITNNIKGSGKDAILKLTSIPSQHLEIIGNKELNLKISEGKEEKANIRFKTKDKLGAGSINFIASYKDIKAHYESTLSVRPAVPSMVATISGYVENGLVIKKQERNLYPEFAKIDAFISTLPISLVPGLAKYLDQFPYGCTEQILSKSMPAVILFGQKDLTDNYKNPLENIKNTFSRLRELQLYNGAFSYWQDTQENNFITVYAFDYMILAKEKNLPVPDELFASTKNYIKNMVNQLPSSLEDARIKAYGIYLLTKNGEVTANYLPNLLGYLENSFTKKWHNDITSVYIAASYKLMQLVPEANNVLDQFIVGDPDYWQNRKLYDQANEPFYNSLNRYSEFLSILSLHFPERLANLDKNIIFRIANFIGDGNYSTISSSYAIRAIINYSNVSMKQSEGKLAIEYIDKAGVNHSVPLAGELIKKASLPLEQDEIKFLGHKDKPIFYQISTEGYDKILPQKPINDGVKIERQYLNNKGEAIAEVQIGEVINVVLTMNAYGDTNLENMAIVDMLPAGFEIVPNSVQNFQTTPKTMEENESCADCIAGVASQQELKEIASTQNNNAKNAEFTVPNVDRFPVQNIDAREDRVLAFGTIPTYKTWFSYKIKAVNIGNFITPPAYTESMYERSIKSRSAAGNIMVK